MNFKRDIYNTEYQHLSNIFLEILNKQTSEEKLDHSKVVL